MHVGHLGADVPVPRPSRSRAASIMRWFVSMQVSERQ